MPRFYIQNKYDQYYISKNGFINKSGLFGR